MKKLEKDIEHVSVLSDALRRRMYLFVREQTGPVTREDVALALGLSRKLAAFHLDKLAEEGLLSYQYKRPPGRSGPGAGRPAKQYRVSDMELDVSVPERRYDLVGRLLVDAIQSEAPGDKPRLHAFDTARMAGLELGDKVRRERRLRPPGADRTLSVASDVLSDHGFEPSRVGDELVLRNCPFHSLSRYAPELVCCMNQAFIDGMVRGLGNNNVEAALEPRPGQCCVTLRRSPEGNASKPG